MTASTGYDDKRPSGYKINRIQNFSPEQMQLFKDSFQYINPQSNLARLAGGDPQAFQQMEAPALRQFNELQGNLASRFSGMGSFGGRRSSGFQNAATSAASNFAQELQANRVNLQRQALADLMGYTNSILGQSPYNTLMIKKRQQPSLFDSLLGVFSPAGADMRQGGIDNSLNFLRLMGLG